MTNNLKIHRCEYTTVIQAEFRDVSVERGPDGRPIKLVPGTGITVWRHTCTGCGNTSYSTSHWVSKVDPGHVVSSNLRVRTPPSQKLAPGSTGEVDEASKPFKDRRQTANVETSSGEVEDKKPRNRSLRTRKPSKPKSLTEKINKFKKAEPDS